VLAAVAVLVVGWFVDNNARTTAFERAHAAYQLGDCKASLADYAKADKGTVPWGSAVDSPYADGPERDQCTQISDLSDTWENGDQAAAADGFAEFRTDHADSPSLISLYELVSTSGKSPALLNSLPGKAACSTFKSVRETTLSLEADFDVSTTLHYVYARSDGELNDPKTLVSCAATLEKAGQTNDAWDFYSTALIYKPKGSTLAKATSGTARTKIQLAKEANPGHLPAPARVSGTGSGPAVVVIQNDSTHTLKLTMSGSKPVLATVGACKSCKTYKNVGPSSCPTAGPTKRFSVPAGTYSVLVETDSADGSNTVTPFVGSWALKKGSRYETCFFIVTGPPK
jgi:hypothetical protein